MRNSHDSPAAGFPRSWAFLAIFLLGSIVYAPIVTADFSSDEIAFIAWTEHATARDFLYRFIPPKGEMIYRPLLIVIWSVYYWIWGPNAALYHIQLVAAHLLNGWLLCLILLNLTGAAAFALIAALLFVSTPLSVETVAWILGTDDVYCMMFSLLSILAFLESDRGRNSYLVLSLALGLAALLTRESAVTLPFVIMMCDLLAARKRRGETLVGCARRRRWQYAIYFLLVIAFFAVRHMLLGGLGGYQAGGRTYVPPLGSILYAALVQLPALHAIPLKGVMAERFLPVGLARYFMNPGFVIAFSLCVLAILGSRRKVPWGIAMFGTGWWLVGTFAHWQVLNKLNIVSRDMEFSHYLYQGTAGFYTAVCSLLFCGERGFRRAAGRTLLILMIALFVPVSRSYCLNYRRAFHTAHEILRQFLAMDLKLLPGARVFMLDVPARMEGAPVWWGGTSISVWRDCRPSLAPVYGTGLWHPAVELQVRERYPYRIYMLSRNVEIEDRRNEYEAAPRFTLDYLRMLKPGEMDYFLQWLPGEERLVDISSRVRQKVSGQPPRPVSWGGASIMEDGSWALFGDARWCEAGERGAVRLSVGAGGGGFSYRGMPISPDEHGVLEMDVRLLKPVKVEAGLEYSTDEENQFDNNKRVFFAVASTPGFRIVRVPLTRRIYDLIDGEIRGFRVVFPADNQVEIDIRSLSLR